jgi:hypothetical protein
MWLGLLVSCALGMGLMISPENLVVLGRGVGMSGYWFLIAIVAGCILHSATIQIYGEGLLNHPPHMAEAVLIQGVFGSTVCMAIFLCSRGILTVALSTAVLATAGFVFNEVFLYWFPNFLFAGLLLSGLVVLNLLSDSIAEKLQVAVVIVSLAGLITLSVMGLFVAPLPVGSLSNMIGPVRWSEASRAFLLLVGFDLALSGLRPGREAALSGRWAMMLSLLVPALVLGLWGWVSQRVVPGARLAETTLPHLIAARAIAGDTGRLLMGTVVLCGTVSVVNGLLLALPRKTAGIAFLSLAHLDSKKIRRLKPAVILISGLCIVGMLLAGMAGEPVLEVLVRAGILFWIFDYVLANGSGLFRSLRHRESAVQDVARTFFRRGDLTMVILSFVLIILITNDPERGVLTAFMLSAAAVTLLSSEAFLRVTRRRG